MCSPPRLKHPPFSGQLDIRSLEVLRPRLDDRAAARTVRIEQDNGAAIGGLDDRVFVRRAVVFQKVSALDRIDAGEATFHLGWNLHSAPGNRSNRLREVMTVICVADGGKVTDPANANQEHDMACWLPGLRPGDRVASELNPLVYKA